MDGMGILLRGRASWRTCRRGAGLLCAAALLLAGAAARAQITVNTQTGEVTNTSTGEVFTSIDRKYAQVQPTHVALSEARLDEKTRVLLMRELMAERGFAMRPLPLGHAGLTLEANGGLTPAGQAYLDMVNANGVSSKPGDPVVITDVKIEGNRIVFKLNGGPDLKHRFMRHIELGGAGGPDGADGVPIIGDGAAASGQEATGSRLTLTFKGQVPELTGAEVRELLAPLISFGVESPTEAFADTLPAPLKKAVLEHRVLVGMTTEMVLRARGGPDQKIHETEGQMPFEEWVYGRPPGEVDFVRINGNRVIRVEIAKPGEEMAVYTKDEVSGLMEVSALQPQGHVVKLGDDIHDPAKEAPKAPPTLRKPGEGLAVGSPARRRQLEEKPVRFPKQSDQDEPWKNPDGVQEQPKGQPGAQSNGQAAPASGEQAAPAGTATPAAGSATPASAGQTPPAMQLQGTGQDR